MGTLFSNIAEMFSMMGSVFSAVFDVWFIVFPPLLWFVFFLLWMKYVQDEYGSKIKWVLLEVVPPRDIEAGPLPMESVFAGFAGVEKGLSAAEEFIKGELPCSFSLELVSTEGQVHFYVRTQVGFRNLVEAHFYAHYPNIEITEVPDYVTNVPKTVPNKDWDLWGTDFVLVKNDLYPIKTYKYFEESVTGKMIDPLAGLIETMGKIGPGQHIWLQYIVTPLKPTWSKDAGQAYVDEFLGRANEKKQGIIARLFADIIDVIVNIGNGLMGKEIAYSAGAVPEKKEEQPVEFRLTPGEKDVLKALQANLGKQMFKTRMRHIYIGRRETYSKPTGVSAFIGGIKQFNDQNLNGFKPHDNSKTYANYVMTASRLRYRQRRIFRRYVTRDTDPQSSRFILSTEELATVFHIPDMAITAPSLTRVTAKRSGAPANLPIQE
jgi:hypothetical protein